MLRKILTENFEVDPASLVQNIYRSLETIEQQLQEEIINKQTLIDGLTAEMKLLRTQLGQKDETIQKLEAVIAESQRSIEGNRQLINKLLNDLDRMQQNVEWYKRTYENRSFWGTIKEKISGKLK